MTLSLYQHCLLAVRNAVGDGHRLPMHRLPLNERKVLFKCFERFDSLWSACFPQYLQEHPEFLEGFDEVMEELTASWSHNSFSANLLKHLQQIPSLSRTIVRLCLQINFVFSGRAANANYGDVCAVVAQCKAVRHLTLANTDSLEEVKVYTPELSLLRTLTESIGDQSDRVALESLRVKAVREPYDFRTFVGPLVDDLRSLTLESVRLNPEIYRAFLTACSPHLRALKLDQCQVGGDGNLLPTAFPNLETLNIISRTGAPVMRPADASRLPDCPKLRQVSLSVDPCPADEQILEAVRQLDVELKVNVGPTYHAAMYPVVLQRFGDLVVELFVDGRQMTAEIVRLIVDRCPNLTSLFIRHTKPENAELTYGLLETLLNDRERGRKLLELGAAVPKSAEVVRRIFDVFPNLTRLYLYPKDGEFDPASFTQLPANDHQQLKHIDLRSMGGLTDESLLPLFLRCGNGLESITSDDDPDNQPHQLTTRIYEMVIEHCRMVNNITLHAWKNYDVVQAAHQIASRKLFYNVNID